MRVEFPDSALVPLLESIADHFAFLAGQCEGKKWEELYLDANDVLRDVVAAWRGEVEL